MKKRKLAMLLAATMALTLSAFPAAAVEKPQQKAADTQVQAQEATSTLQAQSTGNWINVDGIEDGQICFDSTTGTITGCENTVTKATIPKVIDGVTVTAIGEDAFANCENLAEINFPETVTTIGGWAFHFCTALKSLSLAIGITSIAPGAFFGCTSLTALEIPANVTNIESYAFAGCSSVTQITVNSNNANYTGIDGVLFDKSESKLIQYPIGNTQTAYVIKDSVNRIEDGAFFGAKNLKDVTIPNTVISIGDWAFQYCTGMTKIDLPDSLTTLGIYVLSGCTSLKTIAVGENNQNFCSEDGILFDKNKKTLIQFPAGNPYTSYTIPTGVTATGEGSFKGCANLTSVTIPSGIMRLGEETFQNCENLDQVSIPDTVTSISSGLFSGCTKLNSLRIPDTTITICSQAFQNCTSLTDVIVPSGVTSIEKSAFSGCSNLTSVSIPSSVTSVGESAFSGCSSLPSVSIPDGVTSIENWTFSNCSNLTSVSIPDGVTNIGNYAFSSCSSLTSVSIPSSVTGIGEWAFEYCSSLTSMSIPGSVTSIGVGAFSACSSLTSVSIPDSVTSIGGGAFCACSSLTSVSIPDSVTSIEDWTFSYCNSLTSVAIPSGVTSIGESTFYNCGLKSIVIPDKVTSIGNDAFGFCGKLEKFTVNTSNPDYYSDENGILFNKSQSELIQYPIGNTRKTYTITKDITQIQYGAFHGCKNLTSVLVDENNPNYSSDAFGVLFDKSKQHLIQYPIGNTRTEYIIPNSTMNIMDASFAGCSNLKSVVIPNCVTSIGKQALCDCGLTSVTIPASVTEIGDNAFSSESLSSAYFRGDSPNFYTDIFSQCAPDFTAYVPENNSTWDWIRSSHPGYFVFGYNPAPVNFESTYTGTGRESAPAISLSFASELLPSAYTVYFAYYDRNGKLLHVDAAPGQNTGYPLLMETYQAHSVRTMTLDAQNRPIADAGQWTEGAHYAVITGIQTGKDSGSGPQAQLLFPDGVKTVVDLTADYGSGTAAAYGKDSAAVVGDLVAYSKNSDGAYALTYAGCTQAAFDQTAAVAAYGGTFALTGSNKIPVGTNPADTDKAESLNTWSIADDAVIYVAYDGSGTDMSTYSYKTITGTQMKKATNGGQGFTCLFAAASRQLDGSGTCNVKLAYVIYNPDITAVSDTYYGYITSVVNETSNDGPTVYTYTLWNGAEYVRVTAAASVAITGVQQDGSDFKQMKSGDLIAYKVNADKVLTEIVDCYDLSAYNAFVDKSNQPQRGNSYGLIGIGQYENGVLTFKALDASQQTDHKTLPAITNRNAFGNWYEADTGTKYIYIDTDASMGAIGVKDTINGFYAQDFTDQTGANAGTLVPNAFFVADKDGTVQLLVLDINGDIMSR